MKLTLQVVAAGVASSLSDFDHAFLAAQAGIENTQVQDEPGQIEATVHRAPLETESNNYQDRITALLSTAWQDLNANINRATSPTLSTASLPVIINLNGTIADPSLKRRLASSLILPATNISVIFQGSCGFVKALMEAQEFLQSGNHSYCLVAATDSLCCDEMLEHLADKDRLYQDLNPVGIYPGEAAVFFLLTTTDRESESQAQITAAKQITGAVAYDDVAHDDGSHLTQVIRQVMEESSDDPVEQVYGQFNGSEKIAYEWGLCQSRLSHELANYSDWHPAINFGETGAASPALALAMACFQLQNIPSQHHKILCWQIGFEGERAAFTVSR